MRVRWLVRGCAAGRKIPDDVAVDIEEERRGRASWCGEIREFNRSDSSYVYTMRSTGRLEVAGVGAHNLKDGVPSQRTRLEKTTLY